MGRSVAFRLGATLGLLALLVLPALTPVATAQTSPPAGACTQGTDTMSVLFLIDQSASMGGTTINGRPLPPSDPTEQRRYAPAYALSRLGEERLFGKGQPINVIGVIGFGRAASVDLPLTAIAPAPKDFKAWEAQRSRLIAQLRADSRGDTDFRAAFELAAQQFRAQQGQCGAKTGKKAIVVVTDGGPCLASGGCDPAAPYWEGDRAYMGALRDYVLSAFAPGDLRLWVLTLSRPDAEDLARVRPDWEDLTRRYQGALIPLQNNRNDVSDRVGAILGELGLGRGSEGVLPCGPAYIDPYTGFLSLWLLKPAEDTKVVITKPDGAALDPADPGILLHDSFGPNEEWVIRSPQAGQWLFAGCQETRIHAEAYPVLAKFKGPTEQVPAGVAAQLQYTLTDTNGDLVPELPGYPLQWEARFARPGGALENACVWHQVDGQPGVFACAPLPTGSAGTFSVAVTVRAKSGDPYRPGLQTVASDQAGATYVVAAVPTPTPTLTPTPMPTATPTPTVPPPPPCSGLPVGTACLDPNLVTGGAILGMLLVAIIGVYLLLPILFPPPRGLLRFEGTRGETRAQLYLNRRWGSVRLGEKECRQRLPGTNVASLQATRGQPVQGRSTVRLTMRTVDGLQIDQAFHDGDFAYVDARCDCRVRYEAVPERGGRMATN